MTVTIIYVLLALTTALSSMYEIFIPIVKELEILHPDDMLIQNKYITYFVFFVSSFVLAPIMFLLIVIPGLSDKLKKSLITGLLG